METRMMSCLKIRFFVLLASMLFWGLSAPAKLLAAKKASPPSTKTEITEKTTIIKKVVKVRKVSSTQPIEDEIISLPTKNQVSETEVVPQSPEVSTEDLQRIYDIPDQTAKVESSTVTSPSQAELHENGDFSSGLNGVEAAPKTAEISTEELQKLYDIPDQTANVESTTVTGPSQGELHENGDFSSGLNGAEAAPKTAEISTEELQKLYDIPDQTPDESLAGKFQEGYKAGKGLGIGQGKALDSALHSGINKATTWTVRNTRAGMANVESSLKSGFSPKNLLVTAGIAVATDLISQSMKGETPNLGNAVRSIATAEFAGSVAGGTLGAAAGSFFVPFLSAIPVAGALAPAICAVAGSAIGASTAGDLANGRGFSIGRSLKNVDWVGVAGQSIGAVAGGALGAALCAPIPALIPVGYVIGSIAGGVVGNKVAHWVASLFGKGDQDSRETNSANLPTGNNPFSRTSSAGRTGQPVSTETLEPPTSTQQQATPGTAGIIVKTNGTFGE